MGNKVKSPYALSWLFALFFIEAIFFIPVDPLLVLYCVHQQKRSLLFAGVATIASVMGGVGGYLLGAFAWNAVGAKLVTWLISAESFEAAVAKYHLYKNYAVLIAGFTPLPYKAITLSAGFCKLPLIPFIMCSLIARGTRFFLVAGSIYVWGDKIKSFIDRSFNQLVVLFTILVLFSIWMAGR